jgi:cellulose 1,4-beta-cellobiosidase
LSWDATPNASYYKIYKSQSATGPYTFVDSTQGIDWAILGYLRYKDTAVSNGTQYYYGVSAVDPWGNESAPSHANVIVGAVSGATAVPPTGLQAVARNGAVDLSWNASPKAQSYRIKMRTHRKAFIKFTIK